jgi:hypothetical protein
MSCCGDKRQEWLNEVNASLNSKPGETFEYTGDASLTVTGKASGKSYQFKFRGDKVVIDHEDAETLRNEKELMAIPPAPEMNF